MLVSTWPFFVSTSLCFSFGAAFFFHSASVKLLKQFLPSVYPILPPCLAQSVNIVCSVCSTEAKALLKESDQGDDREWSSLSLPSLIPSYSPFPFHPPSLMCHRNCFIFSCLFALQPERAPWFACCHSITKPNSECVLSARAKCFIRQ